METRGAQELESGNPPADELRMDVLFGNLLELMRANHALLTEISERGAETLTLLRAALQAEPVVDAPPALTWEQESRVIDLLRAASELGVDIEAAETVRRVANSVGISEAQVRRVLPEFSAGPYDAPEPVLTRGPRFAGPTLPEIAKNGLGVRGSPCDSDEIDRRARELIERRSGEQAAIETRLRTARGGIHVEKTGRDRTGGGWGSNADENAAMKAIKG